MTVLTSYHNAPDLTTEDYVVLGLATCFVKEDGEVTSVEVIEPIPSAALEALMKGIPTSYKMALGTTLGSVLNGDSWQIPAGFPENAQFSDEFEQRLFAAARTYKRRDIAKLLIPQGSTYNDFQYSTERKRILNPARVVTKDDNVKQHPNTHKIL
ncbi:hypothetical protein NIES4101_41650 [Calothrix sp. NIES-4101]|nr:hypothetical protein NIES4101_41650 [Calothrix sp. NIES-4101]